MTKQVSRIPVIENTSLGKIGRHKTKNFEHTRRSKLTTLISCGVMSCLKLYPHKHQFGFLWSMVRVAKRFSVKTPTQPKLNSTSIQHNLSWVRHENDFAHHHPTTHTNSMSAISPLLPTRFWWNFKGSFLGTCRTDSNYQVDICWGNICPY